MPGSSNPSGGTDIGPVPDGATPADVPATARTDESSGPRKVRADNADPVIDSDEGAEASIASAAPLRDANGATDTVAGGPSNGPSPVSKQPGDAPAAPEPQENFTTPASFWPTIDCTKSHEQIEAALYDCMKTKYGAALVTDMDDAGLLLSYVTRNALQEDRKVGDEVIQTLIASRERLRAGLFDSSTEEAKFRAAYGTIAKAAQPVTVASLRDSLMVRSYRSWFRSLPEPRPIAEIACLHYRNLAFLVLFALLAVQSYWTATSSVLSKTDGLIAEINRAPTRQWYIAQDAALRNGSKGGSQTAASPGPSVTKSDANTSDTDTSSLQPVSPVTKTTSTELTRDELVSKIGELDANYSMLGKFMWPFGWLEYKPDPTPAPKKDPGTNPPSKQTSATTADSSSDETPGKDPYDALFAPSKFQSESAAIRAVAVQVIDVMQKWLLPLLYGALGAMVFVVRTLSMQARDRLFRKEALVSLILRVFLGMISGLAIGWFWTHDSSTDAAANGGPMTLSTLSPFALAFIAGYGVELFFALLDKIVSTFTNKNA